MKPMQPARSMRRDQPRRPEGTKMKREPQVPTQRPRKHLPLRRRRVPVRLQLGARECGTACLSMVLGYHGREATVAECREHLGMGRDGTDAAALAAAARAYGLRPQAYSIEPEQLPRVPLPAIAHWNFNHFVVVERCSPRWPGWVEIVDPARGRRRVSAEELDAAFTGIVLTLEAGPGFAGGGETRPRPWRSYLAHMLRGRGVPGLLLQILAASLALQLLGLALPLATKLLVDRVIPHRLVGAMETLGAGIAVWAGALLVTNYLRGALLLNLQAKLDSRMMLGFFEHLLSLPFPFFQQRAGGDLMMRVNANSLIREMLTSPTLSLFLDGGFVLVYLAVLALAAPGFAAATLAVGAVQLAILAVSTRRLHGLMQRDLQARAEQESYLVEALHGIATLKACGGEERALELWSSLFLRHLDVTLERGRLSALVDTAMSTLRTASPLALVGLGTARVLAGAMSLGDMLACLAVATAFLAPLSALVANAQQLQVVGAHLDRIVDVLEAAPEQDPRRPRRASRLAGAIATREVSFRYHPRGPLVLDRITFAAAPGQKLGLVGRTGSGKSTLALLLLGFYPPSSGEILYDGVPLADIDLRSLRRQLGVVLQEPHLWSGSVRANIAAHDAGMPLAAIERAARLAALADEITAMPMGYETLLTEGGISLSGGQRQRLALARALAHRPTVVLLDEATSQLDSLTEQQVDRNLSQLGATRIVIAHRLSTVANADQILVLAAGRIVERGTHRELLARGGHYAELASLQPAPGGAPARDERRRTDTGPPAWPRQAVDIGGPHKRKEMP
jgi:ATP-binding cassette subfamily B protein